MKTRLSPTIVGAFVVGALLLLVFAVVNFGAGGLFRQPARFLIEVRQTSVSGLDPGSSVKLSGVRVGRVESVQARLDPEAGEVIVRVLCDIDEDEAAALFPPPAPPTGRIVRDLVARGLRAKLSFSGITGLVYVDLQIVPEARGHEVEIDAATGVPIVPVEPSLLAEVADTLSTIAGNLALVDFAGISTELHTLLANLNRLAGELDIKGVLGRISAAAAAVEKTAGDDNLRLSLQRLSESMEELRLLLAGLRAEVPVVKDDLQTVLADASLAMKSVSEAAQGVRSLAGPSSGLAEELGRTLAALQQAAATIERLADYLERNPGALVRGRAGNTDEEGKSP